MINWSFLKNFLQYFLPLVLGVFIISILLFELHNDSELHIIKSREKDTVHLLRKSMENEFESIVTDLLVLSESAHVKKYLTDNNNQSLPLIIREFQTICKWKKNYDQLRLIQLNGDEIVRINMKEGKCLIVDKHNMQNKSKRYYFAETVKLDKNELYISPFDLNIENDKVEYPLKPVIRIATPVYDFNNNKKGIIVINYLGNRILNRVEEISKSLTGDLHIINKDGYWLKSPNPENDWGFMFSNKINKKFEYLYNNSWQAISANDLGQFENEFGIFTYQSISPISDAKLNFEISNQSNHWKIISHILPETISASAYTLLTNFIIYNAYILGLIILLSYLLARAKNRKKVHEESLKEKDKLQGVLEMAGAVSHEINQPLQIISTYVDLLIHPDNKNNNVEKMLQKIVVQIERIGQISKKLSRITKYKTRHYLNGVKIIDIDKSTGIHD